MYSRSDFSPSTILLRLSVQCILYSAKVQDAGVAYKQCGRLEEKLKNPEVAASFYHEAALCFQKDDPQGVTARRGSTVLSSITESAVTANFSFFGATFLFFYIPLSQSARRLTYGGS